jgi:hypothetical protein
MNLLINPGEVDGSSTDLISWRRIFYHPDDLSTLTCSVGEEQGNRWRMSFSTLKDSKPSPSDAFPFFFFFPFIFSRTENHKTGNPLSTRVHQAILSPRISKLMNYVQRVLIESLSFELDCHPSPFELRKS